MEKPTLFLAVDAASPRVSVAVGRGGPAVAERSSEIERSSGRLMDMIAEVLEEAGARPADLTGAVALRGPGSFTGLRVALATVLGLHQALGVKAMALPTLRVLAAWAAQEEADEENGTIVAAVDALRGEWSSQAFRHGRPLGEMDLVPGASLHCLIPEPPATIVGFGVSRLAAPDLPPWLRLLEAGPLAATAVRLAADPGLDWDPDLLVRPLYARPPAVTAPKPRLRP